MRLSASKVDDAEVMVSAWWIVWAFVAGGYAGMLLIALIVIARRAHAHQESVFE
jgi:hypothetical protein